MWTHTEEIVSSESQKSLFPQEKTRKVVSKMYRDSAHSGKDDTTSKGGKGREICANERRRAIGNKETVHLI